MKNIDLRVLVFLSLLLIGRLSLEIDPSDFFTGAKVRPKLVILHPENGQVLDNGDLQIKISMEGYELPSKFHGSKICVGLSSGTNISEDCFEEVPDLTFQAGGLTPGNQYALRIVLYERGNAIAVSVRNFKVGGVKGIDTDEVLTIQTAVQVALKYQMMGMEAQAEMIYRSILSESPSYPDALHLLGVVFFQKGDPQSAIPYIERALMSNKSFEGFHNSLGVCYRKLGRISEAENQFKLALSLNPNFLSAVFNLGLVYQQQNRWDDAILNYRTVLAASDQDRTLISQSTRTESKVRECDLLLAMKRTKEAAQCLKEGVRLFPHDKTLHNELGTLYSQFGDYDAAMNHFKISATLGNFVAKVNVAHNLETQGYEEDSKKEFQKLLKYTEEKKMITYYMKIRLATIQPRILPNQEGILLLRKRLENDLVGLLENEIPEIDNANPLSYGYTNGFFFLFHGAGHNILLKTLLHKVYVSLCPALLQGFFIEKLEEPTNLSQDRIKESEKPIGPHLKAPDFIPLPDQAKNVKKLKDENLVSAKGSDSYNVSSMDAVTAVVAHILDKDQAVTSGSFSFQTSSNTESSTVNLDPGSQSSYHSGNVDINGVLDDKIYEENGFKMEVSKDKLEDVSKMRVKLGFVSASFTFESAGILVQGLLNVLTEVTTETAKKENEKIEDDVEFEIFLFIIDGGKDSQNFDFLQKELLNIGETKKNIHIQTIESTDINNCANTIRQSKLDILVYPDLGKDKVSYFLSFSRLATVQTTWLGHPDTSGIKNVDFFLSSDMETSKASDFYTEELYRFKNFGSRFIDSFSSAASQQLDSPKAVLLLRTKVTERLGIPRSAHLYVIVAPLIKLHKDFDEVILRILLQDRLGYVIIADTTSSQRVSWQNIFLNRMAGKYLEEVSSRVVFTPPAVVATNDVTQIIQVAHVVLDPFPISGDLSVPLSALAIGIPVITLPSNKFIGGRLTLLLYRMLKYGYDFSLNKRLQIGSGGYTGEKNEKEELAGFEHYLVVTTAQEYVSLAIKLTHQPKLRASHQEHLLERRNLLFGSQEESHEIRKEWVDFSLYSLKKAKTMSENVKLNMFKKLNV